MIKRENKEKTKWLLILFLAIVSFIIAFMTQKLIFNDIAICLAMQLKQLLRVDDFSKNRKRWSRLCQMDE